MKKTYLYLLLLIPLLVRGQLFNENESYASEWIWGLNKNTNGGIIGGIILRYSRTKGNDIFETYGLELSNVKHRSEIRQTTRNGTTFSFPKSNYLYAIRMQYGRDKILFRKANQQGVQINASAALGPTIGLESPYYVSVSDGSFEPFDPDVHTNPGLIIGSGRLFQGLGESKIVPGLNAKSSLLFEFGTYRSNVAGLELGVMLEAYSRKIIIVATQPNNAVYTSVFFTLFWGKRR